MPKEVNGDRVDDTFLVARCLQGDSGAFGILVERYWKMAVAIAMSRIDDPAQAEDVAQESFVKAYRSLHKLRNPLKFAGWLSKIVARQSADHLRTQKRHPLVLISEVPPRQERAAVPEGSNPGLTERQRQFVREAVKRLPDKFQRVVIMRFAAGLSAREIAVQLGKRPGTVRIWLHRAYQQLRKEIAPLLEEGNKG